MRIGLLALAVIGGLEVAMCFHAGSPVPAAEQAAGTEKSSRVLRHIVMYKFPDDMTPAQIQEVVDAFKAMVKQIDTVVGFEYGANLSKEGKSEGLTHVFVVSFKDEAGRDAYIKHPAHAAYAKFAKDRREKVVVADYWSA
jgi:heme-degrading monooxygenase HmoA